MIAKIKNNEQNEDNEQKWKKNRTNKDLISKFIMLFVKLSFNFNSVESWGSFNPILGGGEGGFDHPFQISSRTFKRVLGTCTVLKLFDFS